MENLKSNNEKNQKPIEQASDRIKDVRIKLSEHLNLEGDALEEAVDDFIVDKASYTIVKANEDGIITAEEQSAIDEDLNNAAIRTLDEVAEDRLIDTPVDKLADNGFANEIKKNSDALADCEHRGFDVRKSIDALIEYRQKRHSDKMVDKARRMLESGERKYVRKFIEQVRSGKINIGDDRIASSYLSTFDDEAVVDDYRLKDFLELGISIDCIAQDGRISELLAGGLVRQMNESIEINKNIKFSDTSVDFLNNFPIADTSGQITELLMKNPEYKQKITDSVDIQSYGALVMKGSEHLFGNSDFMQNDESHVTLRERAAHNVTLLKELGYKPFATDDELSVLFDGHNSLTRQDNLSAIGLIDNTTVDRMYMCKWERIKDWMKNGRKGDMPRILMELEPSEGNEAAIYWRKQSENLGRDAVGLLLGLKEFMINDSGELHWHDLFGEYSDDEILELYKNNWSIKNEDGTESVYSYLTDDEVSRMKAAYIQNEHDEWTLFEKNGLPKTELFADKLMYIVKHYNWEGCAKTRSKNDYYSDLMRFLAMNSENINGEDKGFVSEWSALDNDEAREAFLLYTTSGHNIQRHLFDENGKTAEFYRKLLYENGTTRGSILNEADANWRDYFSASELSYMKFDSLYVLNSRCMDRNLSLEEQIAQYFDENGPTKIWIDYMNGSNKSECIYQLASIPELLALCEPKQQKYLEFLKQSGFQDFLFDIHNKDAEIDMYFDESGAKPQLWQLEFLNGEFDFIAKQPENIRESMQLSKTQQRIMGIFFEIDDEDTKKAFKDFVLEDFTNLTGERLELASIILNKIANSNASEISQHSAAFTRMLLRDENPEMALEKIEEVFVRNNLPYVGKLYTVFDILHPADRLSLDFGIENSQTISPTLKQADKFERQQIIFTDLLKCALGSNNRSLRTFLSALSENQGLIDNLASGQQEWEDLSEGETSKLQMFVGKLATVYNKTEAGKVNEYIAKADLEQELSELIQLFKPSERHSLSDRVVRMFASPMGLDSLEDVVRYMDELNRGADQINRKTAEHGFSLDKGDFVKGIGGIGYLPAILQNGSVAREFLGDSACGDSTPLDTDLSMILEQPEGIDDAVSKTVANSYGPIWFALKGDDRFKITRDNLGDREQPTAVRHLYQDDNKLEAFHTGILGDGHYGIRTGFASSNIDAIIVQKSDERVALEVVKNGFYIPIVDRSSGKIIFSPDDYDKLAKKMSGLSYYGKKGYEFATSLSSQVIDEMASFVEVNERQTSNKRDAINRTIGNALNGIGLKLKDFDGVLTRGVELIDTGSTGRGTNAYGDGDFDFMMRVDRSDFLNSNRLAEIKKSLSEAFNGGTIGSGDFRLKEVYIKDLEQPVDIDITFVEKTNKLNYSTEQALKDRLESIRQDSYERYCEVVANILLAKKTLKDAGVYKPNRGDNPQGGLGGVGIENWVLQNGGSFKEAANSFLAASRGRTFEEFKELYSIWDFGENHLAARKGQYVHDNFVACNMSSDGFEKMRIVLQGLGSL